MRKSTLGCWSESLFCAVVWIEIDLLTENELRVMHSVIEWDVGASVCMFVTDAQQNCISEDVEHVY